MGADDISEIKERLDKGDKRFELMEEELRANTEATKRIADNTAGLVQLADELAAGTRFLCRVAKIIRFILKEVIEPFWKPVLVIFLALYWIFHDHHLPPWFFEWLSMLKQVTFQ